MAAAAARVRERREREQKEWDQEVAQYGESRALQRLGFERKAAQDEDMLLTSELDDMEIDEDIANPDILVAGALRVNTKLEWSHSLGKFRHSDFNIWEFEELLNDAIEKRGGYEKGWKLVKFMATVRSTHRSARPNPQSMDDLSETEWFKVSQVILEQAQQWRPEMSVKIEVFAEVEKGATYKKNTQSQPRDDTPTPPSRITRTDQLLNRANERADALAAAGNYDRELMEHWECKDKRCRNTAGWCFVDYSGEHFNMDHTQQAMWAKAISTNEPNVSVFRPPTSLYNFWKQAQGRISDTSKKSAAKADRDETKSFMQEYRDFQREMNQTYMEERMQEQLEKQEQRREQREYQKEQRDLLREKREQERWQQQEYEQQQKQCNPPHRPQPILSPHQPPQHQFAPPQHHQVAPPTTRNSSPFDNSDDSGPLLQAFFEWKMNKVSKESWKNRIREVYHIVDNEMWSVQNLQEMNETTSPRYQRAIALGIPDGVARAFKEELRLFKPVWNQGNALLYLQHQ